MQMSTIPTDLNNLNLSNGLKRAADSVCEKAEDILKDSLHPGFTKHDIGHSFRIMRRINDLIDKTQIGLTEKERFVLICAILLHDIGMQTDKYLTLEEKKLPREDQLQIVRKRHHIYSEKFIKENIEHLKLNSHINYVDAIAFVARHHRKVEDLKSIKEFDHVSSEKIRIRLLCALLILGDCLDISNERIDIKKIDYQEIGNESLLHWFTHYYVSDIIPENQQIVIHFKFPPEYEKDEDIVNYFTRNVEIEIKRHVDLVYDILSLNRVTLHRNIDINNVTYSESRSFQMPDNLREYLKKEFEIKNIKYTKEGGLGEIDIYWGGRDAANKSIENYLIETKSKEIFIAAIGFGTIRVLNEDKVVDNFGKLLENKFKITIILPRDLEQLKNFRPEIKEENLKSNLEGGRSFLKSFKDKLAQKCPNINVNDHIEFKCYNYDIDKEIKIIPRHFILQDENTIFVGSYLSSSTGRKSYLMKLSRREKEKNKEDKELSGLFELFIKEIDYIKEHSTTTNLEEN